MFSLASLAIVVFFLAIFIIPIRDTGAFFLWKIFSVYQVLSLVVLYPAGQCRCEKGTRTHFSTRSLGRGYHLTSSRPLIWIYYHSNPQHCTKLPSSPLLLDDSTLSCGMYPTVKVAIFQTPSLPCRVTVMIRQQLPQDCQEVSQRKITLLYITEIWLLSKWLQQWQTYETVQLTYSLKIKPILDHLNHAFG